MYVEVKEETIKHMEELEGEAYERKDTDSINVF